MQTLYTVDVYDFRIVREYLINTASSIKCRDISIPRNYYEQFLGDAGFKYTYYCRRRCSLWRVMSDQHYA